MSIGANANRMSSVRKGAAFVEEFARIRAAQKVETTSHARYTMEKV
jgi:hypothetical protein